MGFWRRRAGDAVVVVAARAGVVALVAHGPGGDVFVTDADGGVAAAHDLVYQHRGSAVFAHDVAPVGIVLVDVGPQAGGALVGSVGVLGLGPVVFDVGDVLVEDDARAGIIGAIGDEIHGRGHPAPL